MEKLNVLDILKKIPVVLIIVIIALLSVVILTPYTTDPANHTQSIEMLDEEIESVMMLSAGATGVSAAISLLPGDACTPISEQFADLVKYFLIVLSALYLEKYLVTLVGTVSFTFIFPSACLLLAIGYLAAKDRLKVLAVRIAITAVALYLVIPASVKTSEAVYSSYKSSLENTIDTANEISVENDDASVVDKFTAWIENAAVTVVDYVTDLLSRFVEAIAVMLVTSCLIPILMMLLFIWAIKLMFKADPYLAPYVDNIKLPAALKGARIYIEEKKEEK